jgi:hypothetical protein
VSDSQPAGQLKINGITSEETAGVVAFSDIRPGTYQIQVSCYGYSPETLEVTIRGGQTESIVVKLCFASPPPVT